ncbi:MAG: sulfotransferase [Gammaproteobacteria bacterium]|nr:sulfotransferase [Gammaproteobacteria bacterium]MYL06730.1 sulfotransferase [Gemmatimonadales bacterium]
MVSDILNRHPRVLSVSEFFSYLGMRTFRYRNPTGAWMWDLYSRHRIRTTLMAKESYKELLYPFDGPQARFTRRNVPPILCATLPHLTDQHEALFDELELVVEQQPRQSLAAHFRHLFSWLGRRFGGDVWAERSGGSLLFASLLLRQFPEARVVHVYRDGRETAISMSRHYPFRMMLASLHRIEGWRINIAGLLSRDRLWNRTAPWVEPLANRLLRSERLNYDSLTLEDFGTFWAAMIEKGDQVLGHLPTDRLLNVKFEDVQLDPCYQIRRLIRFIDPSLEDHSWLRDVSSIPRPMQSKFAQLSPEQQTALTEACLPALERLDYPI